MARKTKSTESIKAATPAKKALVKEAPQMSTVERLNSLYNVSKRVKGFQPAMEVLTKVRAHPTIFPLYDRATGVGGHPIERITLIHGPSNMGKTAFTHGLGLSFLRAGNFYSYIDAEFTSPEDWLRTLMKKFADHPGFLAKRPKSYEDTVDSVREFVNTIGEAREKGELESDTTALVVVDSIRKLVPEGLLKKLLKGDGGLDGASGRGAMMKAALNAQWLDELVPLLYHTKTALVFIAREYDTTPDVYKAVEPGEGKDYKVGGGKGLVFESSIVGRVTRTWVKDGTGESSQVVGERHCVEITKTKVSGKQHKIEKGYFHTSNGLLVPAGFDRARDVLELALDAGVVQQSGSWFSFDGERIGNGTSAAVKLLTANEALLDTIEGEARGHEAPKDE
jgi:recombination protein RecA